MADKGVISVTICGGGNGAHTLAGIASANQDLAVTVLDVYEDETERWTRELEENGFTVNLPTGDKLEQLPGKVRFKVTRDVPVAVSQANVVIFVVPAYAHQVYFELIVPHLSNDAYVVGMPGQPGFEYQCLHFLRKHGKTCSLMALETLPWACRINSYGNNVTLLGFKDEVRASIIHQGTHSLDPLSTTQKILGPVPALTVASSALEICLVSKAIIHPPILYATWQNWQGEEIDTPPLFYQGVDEKAVKYLNGACNEIVQVAAKLREKYPQFKDLKVGTIHEWLLDHYGDQIADKSTLLKTLRTTAAYNGLVHPMTKTSSGKYVPNFSYRYMTEDIPYGIVVQHAVAEMVGVATPVIDEIITWSQGILGVEFLLNGKVNTALSGNTRIPQMYGLNSLEDLLKFCQTE